jgi:hypothetical protein
MAIRLSALHAGRALPQRDFMVFIYVAGWVNLRAMVRLEVLDKLKKIHSLHRVSNSRPSGLWQSASTNYATACPMTKVYINYIKVIVQSKIKYFVVRRWTDRLNSFDEARTAQKTNKNTGQIHRHTERWFHKPSYNNEKGCTDTDKHRRIQRERQQCVIISLILFSK